MASNKLGLGGTWGDFRDTLSLYFYGFFWVSFQKFDQNRKDIKRNSLKLSFEESAQHLVKQAGELDGMVPYTEWAQVQLGLLWCGRPMGMQYCL